jgi:hypothetical protein
MTQNKPKKHAFKKKNGPLNQRKGWAKAFSKPSQSKLLFENVANQFDKMEWEW